MSTMPLDPVAVAAAARRLQALLVDALGPRHEAIDDLVLLIFASGVNLGITRDDRTGVTDKNKDGNP